MSEENKKEKVIYISHSGELLIWLVIILIVVSIFSLTGFYKENNSHNDYRVYLQDVDGLIVGSPVRMMGLQVGHVTKIQPTGEEVYVKFIITNPDIHIPQGTELTVEFSGMAGSKSLELYLPDKNTYIDNTVPLITVLPPKRLHDALGLLNEMYKKLTSIIYTASSFGTQINEITIETKETLKNSTPQFKDFIKFSDTFLEKSDTNTAKMRQSIEELKKHDK